MGRLLRVHPYPVCNYHVEGNLHEGGSGIDTIFLRNHYALAVCDDCHHLVSVLVPNTTQETEAALKTARADLVQLEADAVIGDPRARYLVPFFRAALDEFDDQVPVAVSTCTMCGSSSIRLVIGIQANQFDAQGAWLPCPRCEEGRLLVETEGTWD